MEKLENILKKLCRQINKGKFLKIIFENWRIFLKFIIILDTIEEI